MHIATHNYILRLYIFPEKCKAIATHMHTYIHMHAHIHTHTYTHTQTHTQTHTHTHSEYSIRES